MEGKSSILLSGSVPAAVLSLRDGARAALVSARVGDLLPSLLA